MGWSPARESALLGPVSIGVISLAARTFVRPMAALALPVLAHLHYRFYLTERDLQSRGWRGDGTVVFLIGLLSLVPKLVRPILWRHSLPHRRF